MTLLPRRTVGGTDASSEYGTENALFYRLNWQWYLNMQGVSPQFGRAEPETWAFTRHLMTTFLRHQSLRRLPVLHILMANFRCSPTSAR